MYLFSGPAEVRGFYQKIRELLQPILIVIFMVAPWITINGQPLILVDFNQRHFVFFGITFFSHDAPLLFFLLIIGILTIFIITALFGRLWCGWTCPQTVFLHALFNKIEKLILGSHLKRQIFFNSEDSFFKKIKTILIYIIFLIISWILAHSLVAYFLGAEVVTKAIVEGPSEHLQSFVVLTLMTLALFFNFTFFREKFCFFICPYGRFQNALIDTNSLVVFYDLIRGEPRGHIKTNKTITEKGDCVDCNRCVAVCPTKIDIRNGFQLECIACGKCIDACNEVMQKTKRQPNLIRYETGNQKKISYLRFRLVLYALLLTVFTGAFIWTLVNRNLVDINLSRAHSKPFSVRYDGVTKVIINQIVLHIHNQTPMAQKIRLSLSAQNLKDGYQLSTPASELELSAQQDIQIPAFLEISEKLYQSEKNSIELILKTDNFLIKKQLPFVRVE